MTCAISPTDFDDQDFRLLRAGIFLDLLFTHVSEPAAQPRLDNKLTDEILVMLEATKEVIAKARTENGKLQSAFKRAIHKGT